MNILYPFIFFMSYNNSSNKSSACRTNSQYNSCNEEQGCNMEDSAQQIQNLRSVKRRNSEQLNENSAKRQKLQELKNLVNGNFSAVKEMSMASVEDFNRAAKFEQSNQNSQQRSSQSRQQSQFNQEVQQYINESSQESESFAEQINEMSQWLEVIQNACNSIENSNDQQNVFDLVQSVDAIENAFFSTNFKEDIENIIKSCEESQEQTVEISSQECNSNQIEQLRQILSQVQEIQNSANQLNENYEELSSFVSSKQEQLSEFLESQSLYSRSANELQYSLNKIANS